MKKTVFIIALVLLLTGCLESIDHIRGGVKVENRVQVYIDNLSSKNITTIVGINNGSATFGGITITKNTTGEAIEVVFSKDLKSENGEIYGVDLAIYTSGSALEWFPITAYNKYADGIYIKNPRPKIIIKDSQTIQSEFDVERLSY